MAETISKIKIGNVEYGLESEKTLNDAKAYTNQHTAWTKIYDSGSIGSKVNAFLDIGITGYKRIKVAVKCVNTMDSTGASAADVTFVERFGDESISYSFYGLFGNLLSKGTGTTAAIAEFTIVDGFIICDNALRSTNAPNMLSNADCQGAWNMTSVGGGVMTCNGNISSMAVSSAYMSESYYFAAGSRVIVWGCEA